MNVKQLLSISISILISGCANAAIPVLVLDSSDEAQNGQIENMLDEMTRAGASPAIKANLYPGAPEMAQFHNKAACGTFEIREKRGHFATINVTRSNGVYRFEAAQDVLDDLNYKPWTTSGLWRGSTSEMRS